MRELRPNAATIAVLVKRISKPNAKAASEALRSSAFSSLSIFILGATMFRVEPRARALEDVAAAKT